VLIDRHKSIWIFKRSTMLHHVDWQTVTQVLSGMVPLKCWYLFASWHDITSFCKKQISHSLVPPRCVILRDTKQPILHQNMNWAINETNVSFHSAQPTLLPQIPVLCITRCYTYIVPCRHLHVYALSYQTGQRNKFTYFPE